MIFETERLFFRHITNNDSNELMKILGDPEVMRFSVCGAEDHTGVQKFIDNTLKRYRRDGLAQWAVILKKTEAFIGECGISVQEVDGVKEFEIGYRLNRAYWGKGFATEAATACRDFGTQAKNIERLISIIETENYASIRVAEKVGMQLEKDSVFHKIPVKIYSLCKGDVK
jgi:RimJ/RimL family protein N-acetyltransferase